MPYLHCLVLCALVCPRQKFRLWAKAIYLPFGRCDMSRGARRDMTAKPSLALCFRYLLGRGTSGGNVYHCQKTEYERLNEA